MALKRSLLFFLSLVVASFIGISLLQSFSQPQVQDRLALAQTYLTLQASEFRGEGSDQVRQALLGERPYETALNQYRPLLDNTQGILETTERKIETLAERDRPDAPSASSDPSDPQLAALKAQQQQQQDFLRDLQLEAGILEALADRPAEAQGRWQLVQAESAVDPAAAELAQVLSALWNDPPRLLPEAEPTIRRNLRGWFRDEALARLYNLSQRQSDLETLETQRQAIAQQTLTKLAFVVGLPLFSLVAGIGVLLVGLVQALRRLRSESSDQSTHPLSVKSWDVPWDGATTAIGILGGFFLIGQILISSGLGIFISAGVQQIAAQYPAISPIRFQAIGVFIIYNLMAAGVLGFLYLLLRRFWPLPADWFSFSKGRWLLWGLCGYLAASPLVRLVSVVNQQIWEGQGGSNPLLTLALENQDNLALLFFFVTAAIAAPIFEEIFFRGFLMASLTRVMPGWAAVLLSALIFAAAHLSLSEVLPLMTLGIVLGFVYGRSRNLLASILLHSLWNSSTLVSLFLLGSALRGG